MLFFRKPFVSNLNAFNTVCAPCMSVSSTTSLPFVPGLKLLCRVTGSRIFCVLRQDCVMINEVFPHLLLHSKMFETDQKLDIMPVSFQVSLKENNNQHRPSMILRAHASYCSMPQNPSQRSEPDTINGAKDAGVVRWWRKYLPFGESQIISVSYKSMTCLRHTKPQSHLLHSLTGIKSKRPRMEARNDRTLIAGIFAGYCKSFATCYFIRQSKPC